MVRASKSSEKATTPKPTKKTTKSVPKEAPVEAPAKAEPVNEVTVAEPGEQPSTALKMTEFSAKLQQLTTLFSNVKTDFKTLEKAIAREMKNAAKAAGKKRKSNSERKPTGFVMPTRISDELAKFLGKEIGTEMSRTQASKEITEYIRAHNLQDKDNGRIIHPDAKLVKLLNYDKDPKANELHYFNLQRYLKHHFAKSVKATA
jgi:chromatin remodeling complex protein RSC6